jgi:hypothetical protein
LERFVSFERMFYKNNQRHSLPFDRKKDLRDIQNWFPSRCTRHIVVAWDHCEKVSVTIADHCRLEIYGGQAYICKVGVLVVNGGCKQWKVATLRSFKNEWVIGYDTIYFVFGWTYPIAFSCHMQSTTTKLGKVLEENSDEGSYVSRRFFSRTLDEQSEISRLWKRKDH